MVKMAPAAAIALAAATFAAAATVAATLPHATPTHHAAARLIAGDRDGDARSAGLEITLDPGYKTYWRMPGESGLPPRFDWSGSRNVAKVEVAWPAPRWIEDAAGIAYGYEDRVVLPLTIYPKNKAEPATLALRLDYGVCRELCIPEHAELARDLAEPGSADELALIQAARREVPSPVPLGAETTPALLAVERTGPDRLGVTIRIAEGAPARLFVEAPDPWFLLADADPIPVAAGPVPDPSLARFDVRVLQRPAEAKEPLDLTFTLQSGRAIETRLPLDAALLTR